MSESPGDAAYVFRVRFRLPTGEGVSVDPDRFETTLERVADPPPDPEAGAAGGEGDPRGERDGATDGTGWLFFRDHLWRGAVNDEPHLCDLASDALGVPVESATFRELRTDRAYLDALEAAIAADLDTFRADDVAEVLHKYLGSSIHVRDGTTG